MSLLHKMNTSINQSWLENLQQMFHTDPLLWVACSAYALRKQEGEELGEIPHRIILACDKSKEKCIPFTTTEAKSTYVLGSGLFRLRFIC